MVRYRGVRFLQLQAVQWIYGVATLIRGMKSAWEVRMQRQLGLLFWLLLQHFHLEMQRSSLHFFFGLHRFFLCGLCMLLFERSPLGDG